MIRYLLIAAPIDAESKIYIGRLLGLPIPIYICLSLNCNFSRSGLIEFSINYLIVRNYDAKFQARSEKLDLISDARTLTLDRVALSRMHGGVSTTASSLDPGFAPMASTQIDIACSQTDCSALARPGEWSQRRPNNKPKRLPNSIRESRISQCALLR